MEVIPPTLNNKRVLVGERYRHVININSNGTNVKNDNALIVTVTIGKKNDQCTHQGKRPLQQGGTRKTKKPKNGGRGVRAAVTKRAMPDR